MRHLAFTSIHCWKGAAVRDQHTAELFAPLVPAYFLLSYVSGSSHLANTSLTPQANPANNTEGVYAGYLVPAIAQTDELENIELGFKGSFFERTFSRMRVNTNSSSSFMK